MKTQDELYGAVIAADFKGISSSPKEVLMYREALYLEYEKSLETGLITANTLVAVMQRLKGNHDGIAPGRTFFVEVWYNVNNTAINSYRSFKMRKAFDPYREFISLKDIL